MNIKEITQILRLSSRLLLLGAPHHSEVDIEILQFRISFIYRETGITEYNESLIPIKLQYKISFLTVRKPAFQSNTIIMASFLFLGNELL